MAEGADRGISLLKGYRILVNKLPDPAAQGSEPVPPQRKTLYTKGRCRSRGARSKVPLAAFAFFAQPDRMRAPKEGRVP